jgi:hypothetical protein
MNHMTYRANSWNNKTRGAVLPIAWPTRDEIAEVCNPTYLASYSARRILAKPTLDNYNLKSFWKESESVLAAEHLRPENHRKYKALIKPKIVLPPPEILAPKKDSPAVRMMTVAVAISVGVILADHIISYIDNWTSEEYKDGKTASGPFCPWCGRPEVEGFSPGTKVRCFCDRLYFIAERKLLHD